MTPRYMPHARVIEHGRAAATPTKRHAVRGRQRMRSDTLNKTEQAYDRELNRRKILGEVTWYAWHVIKLRMADRTWYVPDALVLLSDGMLEIHEVKGASRGKPFIEDDAAVKVKTIADIMPIPVVMVWPAKGGGWNRKMV